MSRLLRQLRKDPNERATEATDLESDSSPIADCRDRQAVTVTGVLKNVALRPIDGVSALEAELDDGTAVVTLVWLGRRQITGIENGRKLTAHGRLGWRRQQRVVYNPRYELGA